MTPTIETTGPTLLVEGSCGTRYLCRALVDARLDHVWWGVPAKRAGAAWVAKAGKKNGLVRRAAARVVQEIA